MPDEPNISINLGYSRWRHGLIVLLTVLVVLYFASRHTVTGRSEGGLV